jgi:hypothetical protein
MWSIWLLLAVVVVVMLRQAVAEQVDCLQDFLA